ncbi:MAG: cation-translocating P-type ATPase [Planctomycetota bacterium]
MTSKEDPPRSSEATPTSSTRLESPASQPIDAVISALQVDPEKGLDSSAIQTRRKEFGSNRLRAGGGRGAWRILLDQFKSVMLLVLLLAALLAFFWSRVEEGIAILAVLFVNGLIGFVSEWRAVQSMDALRQMGQRRARVRRNDQQQTVTIEELVPADIILQEAGDVVPADARLIEANNLRVDESALTGESVAAVKRTQPVDAQAPLAERHSMLYRGTTITEGSAEAVVVATGMKTELGRIAALTEEAETQATPLQSQLNQLGARLVWTVVGIALLVAGTGLLAGRDTLLMIETAIALGIAAVPEGLPIVATIALARGMWLMAQRNALINRLPAVETLGATRVIFTDKTGTLTENRMTLSQVVDGSGVHQLRAETNGGNGAFAKQEARKEGVLAQRAITIGVLCNNASLNDLDGDGRPEEYQGDPTEVALLRAGLSWGLDRDALLERWPEVREVAFDPEVMMMATFHRGRDGFDVAVKGAPHPVLDACTSIAMPPEDSENGEPGSRPLSQEERREWIGRGEQLAEQGLRLLAVADKQVGDQQAEPYESLRFVALFGLYDPPRDGVRRSISSCQSAGVRVVMVTGDQLATARAIGRQVGLADEDTSAIHGNDLPPAGSLTNEQTKNVLRASIFARVTPKQKLQLTEVYQEHGEIVAMTGDGINDAPALKKADIGVAMGRRGTDAARQAADMVLKDDALDSIVAAIGQGRVIFDNIRKSVMFMLCTNVAEIMAVAIATTSALPLPLRPLQILFLNVVTDVFPALALGVGKGDPRIMERPPRSPQEALLASRHWLAIGGWSLLIAACVLVALAVADFVLQFDEATAITVSFLTLAFAKLWFVFNLRNPKTTLWNNDVTRNPWIWAATALCIILLVSAVHAPGLSSLLRTKPPGWEGWLCLLSISLVPFVVGQLVLVAQRRKKSLKKSLGGFFR